MLDDIEELWEKERANNFESAKTIYKSPQVEAPKSKIQETYEGKAEKIQPYGEGVLDPSKSRSNTSTEGVKNNEVQIVVQQSEDHYATSPSLNKN